MSTWGFSGSREGMTPAQLVVVKGLLKAEVPTALHHGGCRGADEQLHLLTYLLLPDCQLVVHPASNVSAGDRMDPGTLRMAPAYVHPAKPALERNADIVAACNRFVAAPGQEQEQLRSGTWATIRRAQRFDYQRTIVLPSGRFLIS